MSTIIFRADASEVIGTGHIMRCLALAEELGNRGFKSTFLVHEAPFALGERILASSHGLVAIRGTPGSPADLEETKKLAHDSAAIIIDSYAVSDEYLRRLRTESTPIVVVDDLADRELPVDLVVNPSPEPPQYQSPAKLLLGLDYALLRAEFAAARASMSPLRGDVRTVLVSLGGGDVHNQTVKVLRGLKMVPFRGEVVVVLGSANPHREAVNAALANAPFSHAVHVDAQTMASLIGMADLVITTASTSSLEALCLGRPLVCMSVADNQRPIAKALTRANVAVDLGWFADVGVEQIAMTIRQSLDDRTARLEMSARALVLVDGEGPKRVASAVEATIQGRKHDCAR